MHQRAPIRLQPIENEPRASSTRREPSGAWDHVGFIGDRAGRLFSSLHMPAGEPRGAVVICPSIMSELLANYTNEIGLARMLSARGIAARRFHYRGTGHSDGDWADITFGRMLEDAKIIADRLGEETGIASPAFLGSRFGALVADAAASGFPGTPLALWEPFADGSRFFQELFRYKRIIGVRAADTPARTFAAFMDEARDRPIDFAGYAVHSRLFESAASVQLATSMQPGHPVLIVGFGGRPAERARPQEIADLVSSRGARVDLQFVDQKIHWLFHRPDLQSVGRVASVTARWFEERMERDG